MIKTLIISADKEAVTHIRRMIQDCCPDISIIATSENQKEAIHRINLNQADLVILDTYLSDGSGFELLSHFRKPDFRIIFISEYTEYAIRAFDYGATGYIVKPIQEQKFITTVNRAMDAIRHEEKLQLKQLETDLKGLSQKEKMILRTNEEIHSVDLSRIIRVEADGNYSTFLIDDGRKIIVSKPMKEYEEILLDNGFFRIHKSHIINIKKLRYFEKAEGGYLVMEDGDKVPVSSRKRDAVIALLESLD